MNNLVWLQYWYKSLCDGNWEHGQGIRIRTIDNPGWQISIPLRGTPFMDVHFESINRDGKTDWIVCRKKNGFFEGYGGVTNLEELLSVFRSWVECKNGRWPTQAYVESDL